MCRVASDSAKMNSRLFFLLFIISLLRDDTASAQHNPLKDPNICGRPTCRAPEKFKYSPASQQIYKYSVKISSLFNGTSNNESVLSLDGSVKLEFLSPCDGILTLDSFTLRENSVIDGVDGPQNSYDLEIDNLLSEHSLRFSFNDGIISEICPRDEETVPAINFKRGILSMLVNSMNRLDLDYTTIEADVLGRCKTNYRVEGTKETSLIIRKIKDLNTCQDRAQLHSIVKMAPYKFRSEGQEQNKLLNSSSNCLVHIDHNIYRGINCREIHILKPFSSNDAGATTIVEQSLTLESETAETVDEQPEITRRTSIAFDHAVSSKATTDDLEDSKVLLKNLCSQDRDDIEIVFSDYFTKFIQHLRSLTYKSLTTIYRQANTVCRTGRKHVLAALPYVDTASSVSVIKDIIVKAEVNQNTIKGWMLSLSFIPRPDEGIMKAATQLLQYKSEDGSVILGVTSLAHTFCSQHAECNNAEFTEQILKTVEDKVIQVYTRRIFDRDSTDNITVALKSIGNLGIISTKLGDYLTSIIEDDKISAAIRTAAVEAYRRTPCAESRDYFERLFRDQYQDVEVRIASYLQLMKCPTYLTTRTIKHALENEQVNQVGSFVWSHLNSLMKSSIPSRVEIQGLLSDLNLVKKFSSDIRKFSHYREGSIYFKEYDVGMSYDSDVIFSPTSYIPKTAMLNLTLEMFGESVNLLEVDGRIEGFEHYLESMFGPKGPLNADRVKEKLHRVTPPNLRWKRSTEQDNSIISQIDQLPNVMENSFGNPKVSLGLKIFGNQLNYATFNGDSEIRNALQDINPAAYLQRILSGKEINYNKAVSFLDSSYVVPTGAGMPLTLNALGTASMNIKIFGSLHAPNFIKKKELELNTTISPSVSLDLIGTMSVDGFFTRTALKLKTSVYTSSALKGEIKIRGHKLVSVKFNIPRQTSEIFGIKSELITVKNSIEEPESGLSGRRVFKSICSWSTIEQTVGLKLCGQYHFINVTKINKAPYFVLAGPAGLRLFLERSDPTSKDYIFEYKYEDHVDSSIVSLVFDTPGSSLRRLVSVNFTIDKQTQNLTLFVESTAGTLLARGRYKNTDYEKYLQLTLKINDQKHFDCVFSLITEEIRHGFRYSPKIYLGINDDRVLELQGTLKLVSKKGTSQYDVDLKFQTKRLTSKLFGYFSKTEASVASSLKLDYKFASTKEQRVILEFSLANRSPRNLLDIRGTCYLFSTSYPNFNFDANFKFQKALGHIESKFELFSSPLLSNHSDYELNKLKLQWLLSYNAHLDGSQTIKSSLSINRPSTGLNLTGLLSYRSQHADVQVALIFKYAKGKEVWISGFWSNPRQELKHMEARLNVTIPSFSPMILHGKLHEKLVSDYIIELKGTWFSGHRASVLGYYKDRSTALSSNHRLKLFLKSPSFQDIDTELQYFRDDKEFKLDMKALNQDNLNYSFLFKHNNFSPESTTTQVKIEYKGKHYTLFSSLYFGDHRRIGVELHIDQIRDIHFEAWEYNKELYKAIGVEIKWDANRDNNQKILASGNFTKLASLSYEGNCLLSYPGRTVLANFDVALKENRFDTLMRLSWGDRQTFAIDFHVEYNVESETYVILKSNVVTPFAGYENTAIDGGYHHKNNMYRFNTSVSWRPDEYVIIDLLEDYVIGNSTLELKLKSSLISTVKHIPTLGAYLHHHQKDHSQFTSSLELKYDPEHLIDIKSNWHIYENGHYKNFTGTVTTITPFNICKSGTFSGHFHYTKTRHLEGFANLNLDDKHFKSSVEGNLRKLTNSMVVLNITTPLEKYKRMEGRFGVSEENRHVVALITYPSGNIGFEILLQMESISEFDVKFIFGMPVSFLQRIMLIALLKPQRADFRAAWNSLTAGFSGCWRYDNMLDFDYSYQIYTPIERFEKNGVVVKLIYGQDVNLETSVKLSQYEAGLYGLYTCLIDGNNSRRDVSVEIRSSLQSFPLLLVIGSLDQTRTLYKTNVSLSTDRSDISFIGVLQTLDGEYDANILLKATTPSYKIPLTNLTLRKTFTDYNLIESHISIQEILPSKSEVSIKIGYLLESFKNFHTFIQMNTPYRGMEESFVGTKLFTSSDKLEHWISVKLHPLIIDANSSVTDTAFLSESYINFNGNELPIHLTGTLGAGREHDSKDLGGSLVLKNKQFAISGNIDGFTRGNIQLTPIDGSAPLVFEYQLTKKYNDFYEFVGDFKHSDRFARLLANITTKDLLDWLVELKVDTSNQIYNKFTLLANATTITSGNNVEIVARTPIPKLDVVKLGGLVETSRQYQHYGRGYFQSPETKGTMEIDWIWAFMENMQMNALGSYANQFYDSQSHLEAFYINAPSKFVAVGGNIDVDKLWSAGSSVTLSLPSFRNMSLEGSGEVVSPTLNEKYSLLHKINYDEDFVILNETLRKNENIQQESNNQARNIQSQGRNTYKLVYKLRTPKFIGKETFVTTLTYRQFQENHNVTCEAFYPEKEAVGFATVDFKEVANMNGIVNISIPFKNITNCGMRFLAKTDLNVYHRYLQVFWPNDTAILDCQSNTARVSSGERKTRGSLKAELPLTTRHFGRVDFEYDKHHEKSTGHATLDYNGNKALEGSYNCLSESQEGSDKDVIHVELQNELLPVGIDYVHKYESDALDGKQLHVYHLKNRSKLNLNGYLNVEKRLTGRNIAFSATHSNRTVNLFTDYELSSDGHELKQHTRLELSPTAWIEYDLEIVNKTTNEDFSAEQVRIDVYHPRRNFTAKGSYNVSDVSLLTEVSLDWDKDNKTLHAGLDWNRAGPHREQLLFQIKHPSFEKDVTVFGEYEHDEMRILDGQLTVDYSLDPGKMLKVGVQLDDNCNPFAYNYSYKMWAQHDATHLKLDTDGAFCWQTYQYKAEHFTNYKRSYLPLQKLEALARVDLTKYELELKKDSAHELSYLSGKYDGAFPIYTANISASHDMNNSSGDFYLNFKEKMLKFDFNMTTDGSQSLHVYGLVPDSRSTVFDIWRDYEDIRVSDISYYLRLNHSRLILSSLIWRPDLKSDIQNGIRKGAKQMYDDFIEGINNTKQYIRSETNDALHGVWNDAKPLIQEFLDDLRGLREIEGDFEELRTFLNESYYKNEFYIKDIVGICILMFDELALKTHFESLPAIVSEIWEVMGESGTKLRESINWVIEKIKVYYKNTTDFIRALLEGDPVDHISDLFKGIVEKYDTFIKDAHVAFISYMERLLNETYAMLLANWHKTLAAIEPTFITFIHYLETFVWNTGQEFVDFLYIRKNEIIESPYFVRFANFAHDMDRFYNDITGNNTISSIIKYTNIATTFLKDKYFNLVPFGKELEQVMSEIVSEMGELRKIPSVAYLIRISDEFYANVQSFCEYFDVEARVRQMMTLLHQKLIDMYQTALESENRYRRAKTKFIFKPSDGIMLLEQKLPMSWHAFNETPKFQEIPELQTMYNVQQYLLESGSSFWDFYHGYKLYTDPANWLPPFKSQAMLVGGKHFVTFDKKYYDFEGNCSYLLATDYVDRNFSIVLSYDQESNTRQLLLVLNGTIVSINLFKNTVDIFNHDMNSLPIQIGDTFVYRENDIILARNRLQFTLECNLKFNICTFEVSGWYFGKTAGLWGTINNEPSDDLLTSRKRKVQHSELQSFADSWAIKCEAHYLRRIASGTSVGGHHPAPSQDIESICYEFFVSKMSALTTCFERVPKEPFINMCLDASNQDEACSSAVSYISMCGFVNTPIRIPDTCVKCNAPNGTELKEGEFVQIEAAELGQSADVVFIIEAKECNRNLKTKKNFDILVDLLHKELTEFNLTDNRYSVVLFGGDGYFDEPHTLVINHQIFTDYGEIISSFDSLITGNGSADIYSAIIFANKLLFRPGVSRNFVLMPCSECEEDSMEVEYAILNQLLVENDITLHILMNDDFSTSKVRDNKVPFGLDKLYAYTKKDLRGLVGDRALRKQISLPKSTLGYCVPLALETNGSVFSGKSLSSDKIGNVKKFASVFGKRVASTARPDKCVVCECSAFNTGVSFMDCYPCTYPTRANIDYSEIDEDEALSKMQPADEFAPFD